MNQASSWDYPSYEFPNSSEIGTPGPGGTIDSFDVPLVDIKIMNGMSAHRGEFPHQVFLHIRKPDGQQTFCGASIIHPLLLLTAAHCVYDNIESTGIRAIAGEHNKKSSEGSEQNLTVSSIIVHEKLNTTTWDNDIAILSLKDPVKFNNFVKSIKIPSANQSLPKNASVSGWGKTLNVRAPDILQKADISFTDSQVCKELWNATRKKVVTENMICAGDNKKDACRGDSGGPLTCKDENSGENFLCGIISFGTNCNLGHYRQSNPGIYVDVRRYHGWIQKRMKIYSRYYWSSVLGKPMVNGLANGSNKCGQRKFECERSGICIPESFKCDGENDCADWDDSDEAKCPEIRCARGRFACADGRKCVHKKFRCDGENDCGDKSDEANCSSDSSALS